MTVDGEPLVFFAHGDERRAEVRRRLEASGLDVDAAAVAAGLALRDFLDATGDLMTWAGPSQGERANALVAALRRVQRAGCEGSIVFAPWTRGGSVSVTVDGEPVHGVEIVVREATPTVPGYIAERTVAAATSPIVKIGSTDTSLNRFQRRRQAAQKRRAR